MANKSAKKLPHERRRGEAALSEFAEYVERQQTIRFPKAAIKPTEPALTPHPKQCSSAAPAPSTTGGFDPHEELDVLSCLDLSDKPADSLRNLLLSSDHDYAVRLTSLLSDRLAEGFNETVFEVGFENNGDSMGLSVVEWEFALARIKAIARTLRADCKLLTKNLGVAIEAGFSSDAYTRDKEAGCSGKLLIRRTPSTPEDVIETRIAVVGNVDAGKSSMLGVLVKGDLDDGRGTARVNLFRHKHEIESGRTSSVGMEIMGFDTVGNIVISDNPGRRLSWEEIGKRSAKVITFTDLAGHERYLRTTVFGMLSSSPNYCLLMVAANNGLIGMSREHLGLALALNVPIMVVITKIDICPDHVLRQTITQITKILKSAGARKLPVFIRDHEECIQTATQFVSQRICPIFQISNVTGENLDLVRTFLNIIPHHGRYNTNADFEFHVNDTFSVPFVGTVVSGIVKSGVIHPGDEVVIGPDSLGQFTTTSIRSIQKKRINALAASAGHSASFALKKVRRKDVRKGMVVLSKKENGPPKVSREFVAEVLILSHATTIKTKYQAMLHVGSVSQTCAIIAIDRPYIRTGDRATVAFQFVQRPEYLGTGDRLIFREGRTKGLGIVKSVGYDPAIGLGVKDPEAQSEQAEP